MKGQEEILPKTEITTTYDDNGNLITEVTEDYDKNKISIKFPLKWFTGSVNPDTMEITPSDYTIEIYQTEDARDPVSKPVIKMKDDPFVLKFYHHDHLGTVRYITNELGEILHTTDTLAYGEELTAPYEDSNDKVFNTITYTGHEKDYETNLTYMLARYYSQGYGRFLSPDPGYDYDQLDPMSWNLYSYVRGNPVMRIDPFGLELTQEEKKELWEHLRKKEKDEIDKKVRKILEDRFRKYNLWTGTYKGEEDFDSTVIDLKVNGFLDYIDWSKLDMSIKRYMIGPLAKVNVKPPKGFLDTLEGINTGERVCGNMQNYVATPLIFTPFSAAGQVVYFAAGAGGVYFAAKKYQLNPNAANKKNLEMKRYQLGLSAFLFLGVHGTALSLPPEGKAIYQKVSDYLYAIVDSAFSFAEGESDD